MYTTVRLQDQRFVSDIPVMKEMCVQVTTCSVNKEYVVVEKAMERTVLDKYVVS